ncbi:MAG: BolA/IbaG family iron-sulfur metabolism protein [Pseudomonadota bacterium]|nr:BolA/IbaG family iron-sulfur metabolism protein [Pseudomonadota bacterium]
MVVEEKIKNKLKRSLLPSFLKVMNESYMHQVPEKSETHFKVIIVSTKFSGKSRIARHQLVNQILAEEIKGPVHALSMQTHTLEEWEQNGKVVLESPLCIGNEKVI